MSTDRKLKIIFGLLSTGLLIALLFKLISLPGGMILSGFFLGGFIIIGIILGCFVITGVLRLVFKQSSFLTLLLMMTAISFLGFHYHLYSPTLTIVVPNGYNGEVNLVLANVESNILTVDTNGIGYLNKWTFNKTYTKPIVEQLDGKSLENNLVGFNTSSFYGKRRTCCVGGQEIEALTFKIIPDDRIGLKHHRSVDLTTLINKDLVQY